jgi:hypothetical protein
MTNKSGEWSIKEIKQLFNFAPEETMASDPDILYAGECIDVERGGIKEYCSQDEMNAIIEKSIIKEEKKVKNPEDYKYLLPQNSFITPVYTTIKDDDKTWETFKPYEKK